MQADNATGYPSNVVHRNGVPESNKRLLAALASYYLKMLITENRCGRQLQSQTYFDNRMRKAYAHPQRTACTWPAEHCREPGMKELRLPEPLGLAPTFGFGDRLGVATAGHLEALRAHGEGILPIFAQQSIREMQRTRRQPGEVIEDARDALSTANYHGRWSADADHLKTPEDVNATAGAGFVFFTIDPSDHVDTQAEQYGENELLEKYEEISGDINWASSYTGRQVSVTDDITINFDRQTVMRAAVKYGRAISHAIKMASHIDRVMSKRLAAYEIELSVDETPQPTTLAEHFIIAELCLAAGMKLVSLAPRFPGDFEKGVDFRGDMRELEHMLRGHAGIANMLGPYKLSLHSGSDKFSMYEMFARVTGGRFHVKTAGTSYLEALRVAARHERKLFRRIINFSRSRFEEDRATYHISARLDKTPAPEAVTNDAQLEKFYLDDDNGRQILHVTFGSVLTGGLGPSLREVLIAEPRTHREVLARHFGKHLRLLAQGLSQV